jgi:glycosyltransferase involved in cell wall biosynthesis
MNSHAILRCPTLNELPPPPPNRTGWPWTEGSSQLPDTMPDGTLWPKISVVTPSFNQGQFIEETIRSVLLQGYPNLEYIIIDGGSRDNSLEIIKKYQPWLAFWVSEPDRGQSHAINKGIQRATGEILYWQNSDDICLPDAFRTVATAFSSKPGVKLVTGQARLIDHLSQIIGEVRSYFTGWEEVATNPGNSVRQISTFFSRRIFDELGLLDENPRLAMDTELLFRFTRNNRPLVLNEYLAAYRTHANTSTARELLIWYKETDLTRLKLLPNKILRSKYRERSAANWINLSISDSRTAKQRMNCLKNAVQIEPTIIFSRSFWMAFKKLAFLRNSL